MRVLHVNDSFEKGGAEIVFQATVKASENLGFETRFFVSDEVRQPISYIYSLKNRKKISLLLDEFQPDIIHIHNYYHYLTPSIFDAIKNFKLKHKIKVIVTLHDFHILSPNSNLIEYRNREYEPWDDPETLGIKKVTIKKKYDKRSRVHSLLKYFQHTYNYRLKNVLSTVDVFICPSEYITQLIKKEFPEKLALTVRNPVFNKKPEKLTISDTNNKIVFAGRIEAEKGFAWALETMGKSPISYSIDVFGEGDDLEKLRAIVATHSNLEVNFCGYVTGTVLRERLSGYKLMVIPSLWGEVVPLVFVEAAEYGLPVVAPDIGGFKETANFVKVAFLYKALDRASFIKSLNDALASTARNEIVDRDVFSFDTYQKKILEVYKD